jgi:iron-regulated transporter 1
MTTTAEQLTNNSAEREPLVPHDTARSWSFIDSAESEEQRLAKARRLLYVSHLFSQFSEIAWQFCLVLFLAAFTNYESLFLVSTYGLTGGLLLCFFGSRAGKFVDGTNRLFAAQRFIWTENLCVVMATVCCYALLGIHHPNSSGAEGGSITAPSTVQSRYAGLPHDAISIVLLVGVHLLGAIAGVLDRGFLVAIERDWVVVMSNMAAHGSSSSITANGSDPSIPSKKQWLTETNVSMKQIDLSCKVVAPAVSGFVIGAFDNGNSGNRGYDLRGAAILVGAVNAAALVVEYICTAQIYVLVPDLANRAEAKATIVEEKVSTTNGNHTNGEGQHGSVTSGETDTPTLFKGSVCERLCRLFPLPNELKIYLLQPVALGGIGLALL